MCSLLEGKCPLDAAARSQQEVTSCILDAPPPRQVLIFCWIMDVGQNGEEEEKIKEVWGEAW